MSKTSIEKAIVSQDIPTLIEYLEDKELPIDDIKTIYYAFKENKEIVGQAAMNLSLRTSVYKRDQEYSETMVELLIDIAGNPVDMGARWAVAKNPKSTEPKQTKLPLRLS